MTATKNPVDELFKKLAKDSEEISELELTIEEERAIRRLTARIQLRDPTWGESLNDEDAIMRVVLASRKAGINE